ASHRARAVQDDDDLPPFATFGDFDLEGPQAAVDVPINAAEIVARVIRSVVHEVCRRRVASTPVVATQPCVCRTTGYQGQTIESTEGVGRQCERHRRRLAFFTYSG